MSPPTLRPIGGGKAELAARIETLAALYRHIQSLLEFYGREMGELLKVLVGMGE